MQIDKLSNSPKDVCTVIDSIQDVIIQLDMEGVILYVNGAVRNYGYEPDELVGQPLYEYLAEEDVEKEKSILKKRKRGVRTPILTELNVKTKQGGVRCCESHGLVTQNNKIIAVLRDITEHRFAENALTITRNKLDTIINTLLDIVYLLDTDGNLVFINEAVEKYGYSAGDMIGTNILNYVHPDDLEEAKHRLTERRTGDRSTKSLEIRMLSKQNEMLTFDVDSYYYDNNPVFIIDASGIYSSESPEYDSFVGTLGVARDITEKKISELKLKESEETYRLLVENAHDGVTIIVNEKMVFVNQRFEELLGYKRKEIINTKYSELVHPEYRQEIEQIRKKRLSGLPAPDVYAIKLMHKNGSDCLVEIQSSIISYRGRKATFSFIRDITEQKKTEEEKTKLEQLLFHVQKMESIGRLAGGIAHDFNNILTSIVGYAQLLSTRVGKDKPFEKKAADTIIDGVERASQLTQQLLRFARGGTSFKPAPVDLNKIIRNVLKVSDKIFDKKIRVSTNFGELSNVKADRSQIDQVLTNLFINARDAMPSGGMLGIETSMIYLDDNVVKDVMNLKGGYYAKLAVSDTGIGMPEEVRTRIFEPFFTTKGSDKGTGLGLATSYGIINNHGGAITVYSEPGFGTTFSIYLPVTEKKAAKTNGRSSLIKGQGTVLLVDDEEKIRSIAVNQLDLLGFKVIAAKNGFEGVNLFMDKRESIDLIITDVVMPEMDGREFVEKIRGVDGKISIIMMSGYAEENVMNRALKNNNCKFLQKPFTIGDLSDAIRSITELNN